MKVTTLTSKEDSRSNDLRWYELEAKIGKKHYKVKALRRESDGFVSVFSAEIESGRGRATSRKSKTYAAIAVAVRKHLGHLVKNPKTPVGTTNAEIEKQTLQILSHIGGGTVLKAVWYELPGDVTYRQAAAALRRLQRKGLAFNHDPGGSLGKWGGVGRKARYWSTREQLKRDHGLTDEDLGPVKNPWEHIGGGCLVGEYAEGKRYPCDDDFEDTETGEQINIRSTVDGHFTQPGRGKTVKRLADIEKHPGVKKGSRRQIKPKKKNPSVNELVRRALR